MKITLNDNVIVKMSKSKFLKDHKHLDKLIDLGAYYDKLKNAKREPKQVVES